MDAFERERIEKTAQSIYDNIHLATTSAADKECYYIIDGDRHECVDYLNILKHSGALVSIEKMTANGRDYSILVIIRKV